MIEGFSYGVFKEYYKNNRSTEAIALLEKGLNQNNLLQYKRLTIRMYRVDIYQNKAKPFRTLRLLENFNEEYLKALANKYLIKLSNCLVYKNYTYAPIILDVLLELVNLGYLELNQIPCLNNFKDYILNQQQEMEYIKTINNDLQHPNLILSETMSEERLNTLIKLIQEEPFLKYFKIIDKDQHLVIHKLNTEKIDYNFYKEKAKLAKENEQYEEALNYYLKILNSKVIPYSYILANIGLLYLKLHNKEEAIKYLTIATYHPLEHNFDFKRIIDDKTSNYFDEKQDTPLFTLNEFEAQELVTKYINLINELKISQDNIDEYCLKNNISNEDRLSIKILVSRFYYANDFPQYADKLLKEAEQDSNNNFYISDLIKETRVNKKLYKYKEEYQQALRLNL